MAKLLKIEQCILEASSQPAHGRILRRIVSQEFDEVYLRHGAFFPHLHSLEERGYIADIGDTTEKYRLTQKGKDLIESQQT